jgi:hypothetical protein
MEKHFDFNGALVNPCELEGQTRGTLELFLYPSKISHVGTLQNLQSQVVQIQFTDAVDDVTIHTEGGSMGQLKYKVYEEGEPDCQQLPDGDDQGRQFSHLEANDVITVVVSNVQYQGEPALVYQVLVERPG